jgi:hypothetical protein
MFLSHMLYRNTAALHLQREGAVVAAVRSFMDGTAPIPGVWERRDNMEESPVRLDR